MGCFLVTIFATGGIIAPDAVNMLVTSALIAAVVILVVALNRLQRQRIKLLESQARFHSLLAGMQDLVFIIDRDKVLREFYQHGSDKLFKSPDEFIGKHLRDIGYPDDVYNVLNSAYDQTLTTGAVTRVDYQLPTPAGLCWFEMCISPIPDSRQDTAFLVGVVRDITERKQAEHATQESRHFLKKLVDSIPIPFFYKDRDGKYVLLNAAFGHFFNLRTEDLLGQSIYEIMPKADADVHHAKDLHLLDNPGIDVYEYQQTDVHGSLRDTIFHRNSIQDEAGRILGIVGAIIDITDQKQAERDRMEMQARVMQAGKLEAIGQLAAGIAHEINNPIQFIGDNSLFVHDSIRGILAALHSLSQFKHQEGDSAERQREIERIIDELDVDFLSAELPQALSDTQEGVRRVAQIIAALREFSHPDGKAKTLTDLNFNIQNTVTITRSEWRSIAELHCELDPDLPRIQCHSGAINQVLTNLIINAAHSIREIHAQRPKGLITVRSTFDADTVQIHVEDNGNGIPVAIQKRIFDPFFTTKPIGQGTGQGLYLCHMIVVKDHGGTIRFETQEGCGTTFTVTLPREAT